MANTAQSANPNGQETRSATHAQRCTAAHRFCTYSPATMRCCSSSGPLLGTRYRTRPIDTADQIAPASVTPWALMIDASARPDARAQAARVKQQYPLAPLLVICADGTASDWASPLARGALTAIIERGALGSDAFEAALSSVDRQMAADSCGRPPGRQRLDSTALSAIPVVDDDRAGVAVGGSRAPGTCFAGNASEPPGGLHATLGKPPPVVAPAEPPAVTAAAPSRRLAAPVLELLSDARVAFRDGKNLLPPTDGTPTGNSALELYAKVLAQDPQNEEAHDGMRRLFTRRQRAHSSGPEREQGRGSRPPVVGLPRRRR